MRDDHLKELADAEWRKLRRSAIWSRLAFAAPTDRPSCRLAGAVDKQPREAAAMTAERGRGMRVRSHLLVAGFVVAYLAAGGMTLALGDRVTSGSWLAVHLVLLGAATNAIVVWS